jgi:hypothetical protein
VGIDATIYPRKQDLIFRNDTGNHILVQAYSKDFKAFVHFYGKSDGRNVALQGPFFNSSPSEQIEPLLHRPLDGHEIAWIQTITRQDGSQEQSVILSRYESIPRSLKQQYATLPQADSGQG